MGREEERRGWRGVRKETQEEGGEEGQVGGEGQREQGSLTGGIQGRVTCGLCLVT